MKRFDFCDILSAALIVCLSIFSINFWLNYYALYFDVYDIANHLAISSAFQKIGAVAFHNFWEFAPDGAPHYYPPLLHLIGAFFLNRGYSPDIIAKWGTWVIYPLTLISAWVFVRTVFGPKQGFYSLVLLSLPLLWPEKIWGSPSNGLFLILLPLALAALVKKRFLALAILTLFCLATHLLALGLSIAIFIYMLRRLKEYRKVLYLFLFIACFSLPFIVMAVWRISYSLHPSLLWSWDLRKIFDAKEIFNRQYFGYIGILGLAGLFISYFRRGSYLILPSLFFSFLPLFFIGKGFRFLFPNAILLLAVSGGIAAAELHNLLMKKFGSGGLKDIARNLFYTILISGALIFLFPLTNKMNPADKQHWPALMVFKSPYLWEAYNLEIPHQDKMRMAEVVKKNSSENEYVFLESSLNAGRAIIAFSGRSVSIYDKNGARIFILRNPDKAEGLRQLGKIGNYYIYRQDDAAKVRYVAMPKKFLIPLKWMEIAVLALAILALINTIDIF